MHVPTNIFVLLQYFLTKSAKLNFMPHAFTFYRLQIFTQKVELFGCPFWFKKWGFGLVFEVYDQVNLKKLHLRKICTAQNVQIVLLVL